MVHTIDNGKRWCYSCKHCFAQIVFYGECGELLDASIGTIEAALSFGSATTVWRLPTTPAAVGWSMKHFWSR